MLWRYFISAIISIREQVRAIASAWIGFLWELRWDHGWNRTCMQSCESFRIMLSCKTICKYCNKCDNKPLIWIYLSVVRVIILMWPHNHQRTDTLSEPTRSMITMPRWHQCQFLKLNRYPTNYYIPHRLCWQSISCCICEELRLLDKHCKSSYRIQFGGKFENNKVRGKMQWHADYIFFYNLHDDTTSALADGNMYHRLSTGCRSFYKMQLWIQSMTAIDIMSSTWYARWNNSLRFVVAYSWTVNLKDLKDCICIRCLILDFNVRVTDVKT